MCVICWQQRQKYSRTFQTRIDITINHVIGFLWRVNAATYILRMVFVLHDYGSRELSRLKCTPMCE